MCARTRRQSAVNNYRTTAVQYGKPVVGAMYSVTRSCDGIDNMSQCSVAAVCIK